MALFTNFKRTCITMRSAMNFPQAKIFSQKKIFTNICRSKGLFAYKNSIRPVVCRNTSDQRLVSTYEIKSGQKREGFLRRIARKIPFVDIDKIRTKASGYFLYENIADKIDYLEFFQKYNLPDTFYSWFVLTELHIWMLSARAMAEGDQGQMLRNSIIEALWSDVARRTKKLGAANPAAMRAQVQDLSEQLQAAFLAYDEGLQSDDIVLAGTVWRRLYQMEYAAPQHVEELVKYIRKHIAILDNLSKEQILNVEAVKWGPL